MSRIFFQNSWFNSKTSLPRGEMLHGIETESNTKHKPIQHELPYAIWSHLKQVAFYYSLIMQCHKNSHLSIFSQLPFFFHFVMPYRIVHARKRERIVFICKSATQNKWSYSHDSHKFSLNVKQQDDDSKKMYLQLVFAMDNYKLIWYYSKIWIITLYKQLTTERFFQAAVVTFKTQFKSIWPCFYFCWYNNFFAIFRHRKKICNRNKMIWLKGQAFHYNFYLWTKLTISDWHWHFYKWE